MNALTRRSVLALAAGAAVALNIGKAAAETFTWYTPEAHAELIATGKPYLMDFWASWCPTCRVQHETIDALVAAKPEYAAVPVLRVDWDVHVNGPMVARMQIPRRSTILVMKGDQELKRLVAGNKPEDIEPLFQLALAS
jgi:thioredoxin 1